MPNVWAPFIFGHKVLVEQGKKSYVIGFALHHILDRISLFVMRSPFGQMADSQLLRTNNE
ncbi:hypothetical protein ABEW34_10755 [Paenibacillus algorifonticola]|uniref:hypothetical protein n=1 Tax=Paenibacillus algorifonticola TaxID=684063 RepID=UPI003D2778D1